jgi:hypothetical protein
MQPSKAFRVTINNIPKLININHISTVTLNDNVLKLYFNVNNGIFGVGAIGFGFVGGSDLHRMNIEYKSNEEAKQEFEKIAQMM